MGFILSMITLFGLVLFALIGNGLAAKEDHPCVRDCNGGAPKLCEYDFHVEWFHTLSKACFNCPNNPEDCLRPDCIAADGFDRMIQVVNRQMPGPKIEVCHGDEIIVNVHNDMTIESTTMHWHGLHVSKTPYMDGVPYVTQCPIQPTNSFKYRLRATEIGTHFWHSHSSVQRSNGVYGALIVRQNEKENVHKDLYDYDLSEHIIIVSDWTESDGLRSFVQKFHADINESPRSILVNGLGRFTNFENSTQGVPAPRFTVEKGMRYRFRIASSTHMTAPIAISFDNHKITAISTDGEDVKPVITDKLTISNGERFDIVLEANNEGDGLHWIRFEGLMSCKGSKAHQAAVLEYGKHDISEYPAGDEPTYETSHRIGHDVNGINFPENNLPIHELSAMVPMDSRVAGKPDKKFYMAFDMRLVNHPGFLLMNKDNESEELKPIVAPHINNIALGSFPFPLLSQRNEIPPNSFCNGDTVSEKCETEFCACPHILEVELGDLVEIIMIDEGIMMDSTHPMHLHGHLFRVVGNERLGSKTSRKEVMELDEQGKLKRNLVDAPLKDTVVVPDGGYTIIRFLADSPGFWILHCHIDFHVELGMGFILKVGSHLQMPAVPRNFPKCGNFDSPPASP